MDLLRTKGRKLTGALPQEAVPTNVIRHILKLIREEYVAKVTVSNKIIKYNLFLKSLIF